MSLKSNLFFLVFIVLTHSACLGADSTDLDDPFIGFADSAPVGEEKFQLEDEGFYNFLNGYTKIWAAWNFGHHAPSTGETDWRGLSSLRSELQLEANYRLRNWIFFTSIKGWYDFAFDLNGRGAYTQEVIEEYENEIELREGYIQGSLSNALDIKIGRQVVVWGRSDNIRVTDVLNPLDNHLPGFTDIEDLRLPLLMSKLDYFFGNWDLSLVAIHEHRYDKVPSYGHDFYTVPTRMPLERKPTHTIENTELALELKGIFHSRDISFYWARIHDDTSTFVSSSPVVIEHRKLMMVGTAANLRLGDFLCKFEAAHFRGVKFMTDYGVDYNRTDLLAGFEFANFEDTIISFDIANRHIHGFDRNIEASLEAPQENKLQAAFRINKNFMHDTLSINVVFYFFGEQGQDGAIQRYKATYSIKDGLSVIGGVVFYQSGIGEMSNIGDNDRLFFEIRYDF